MPFIHMRKASEGRHVIFHMSYNTYSLAVAGGLVVASSLISVLRRVALRILRCVAVAFGLKETNVVCELM